MSGKIWKNEDVELLKVKFFEVDKENDLASFFPDRTLTSVIHKVRSLKLLRRKTWNEDEEKILAENYPIKSSGELGKLIPRWTENEIVYKAQSMKLTKTSDYRSNSVKGEKNSYYGHTHNEQVREHLKDVWTERKTKEGWKNKWSGQPHTEETKKQLSVIALNSPNWNRPCLKGSKLSEEWKLKLCHPKVWTEEGKQRIRDGVMSKPHGGYGIWTDYTRKDGRIVKLQSSYEVRLAQAMDKWNLKWERLGTQVRIPYIDKDGQARMHYPDFEVESNYIFEAKGEHLLENDENTKLKIQAGKKAYGKRYKVFTLSTINKFTDDGKF